MSAGAKPASKSKMIRLEADLLAEMDVHASKSGRTTRQEIEHRLRQSFEGSTSQSGAQHPSWPDAIGRLFTLLAKDLVSSCHSPDEALAAVKYGSLAMTEAFLAEFRHELGQNEMDATEEDVRSFGEAYGRALAMKVIRAGALPHQNTKDNPWAEHAEKEEMRQQPSLRTPEQELVAIKNALHVETKRSSSSGARARKPKKGN